ncbi:MAG: tetratricopeptide repeat protein [Steroidobacteraceae bacterium]
MLLLSAYLGLTACASAPGGPEDLGATPTSVNADDFHTSMSSADLAWKTGDLERAIYFYGIAAQRDPRSELPLLRSAAIHEVRKEFEPAQRAFEAALKLAPHNAGAHERLGFVVLRTGDHERAANEFTTALRIEPLRWRAVMGLGLAAQRRRDLGLARVHFDAALRQQRESAELFAYSAELYLQSGATSEGIRDAKSSLGLTDNAPARLILGDLLARSGDFASGLSSYLEALSQPAAYERLGDEAMRLSDYERALRYYDKSASLSPAFNELAQRRIAVARERLYEQQHRGPVSVRRKTEAAAR